MAERNCKRCFHYKACKEVVSHSGYGDINYTESQCKHFIPAAADVPKSKVEKLQAEAENLRNANADLALALLYECEPTKEHLSELEKAVREKVAKEIFEDIESVLAIHFCSWLPKGATEHYDYYEGDLGDAIAELKKKYTVQEQDPDSRQTIDNNYTEERNENI